MPESELSLHLDGIPEIVMGFPTSTTFPPREPCFDDPLSVDVRPWGRLKLIHVYMRNEELAANTVMTGFRLNHLYTIIIRILEKGGDDILRSHKDCVIFEPMKQLRFYDRNVPMHHMGLRLVIASDLNIQSTTMLKLNNLIFRV